MFRITTVNAIVARDADDEEGIVGMTMRDGTFMPFVAADQERLKQLKPMAKIIGEATNRTLYLIQFSNRRVLEVLEPGKEWRFATREEADA